MQLARLKKLIVVNTQISISNSAFTALFAIDKLSPCLIDAVGLQYIDVICFCAYSHDQTCDPQKLSLILLLEIKWAKKHKFKLKRPKLQEFSAVDI